MTMTGRGCMMCDSADEKYDAYKLTKTGHIGKTRKYICHDCMEDAAIIRHFDDLFGQHHIDLSLVDDEGFLTFYSVTDGTDLWYIEL